MQYAAPQGQENISTRAAIDVRHLRLDGFGLLLGMSVCSLKYFRAASSVGFGKVCIVVPNSRPLS